MKDRLFDIWFSLRCGIANREFIPVLEQYGSSYAVFNADEAELETLPCDNKFKRALANKDLTEAGRIEAFCEANEVNILFWLDKAYPVSLRSLLDPPVLLYCQGECPDFAHLLCISVVGTRKMSEYGKRMAYKIGYELGASGTVVVSGMALGIDSVAQVGAMAAGGRTVAVLGCGIDVVYPREHVNLKTRILRHGVVMTEYPPATPPAGSHFPVRNRIISGLSQGTVVVEADLKSGALITARHAIVQGRDIYAVPGNVGEDNTSGTNHLLREGATMVLQGRDILSNYGFLFRDTLSNLQLLNAEKHSEPDEDILREYGVYLRSQPLTPQTKNAAVSPNTPYRTGASPAHSADRQRSGPDREASPSQASAGRHRRPDRSRISRAGQEQGMLPPQEAAAPKENAPEGDCSPQLLSSLSDTQRALFAAMPLDHAVPVDALVKEGFSMGDIMAAMTVLEIKGLVISLPGGLYARR